MKTPSTNVRTNTARAALRVAGPRDALLAEVRDVSRQWLIARMRVTLARLDDRLFEKAVNSTSATEQNAWFDAMRAIRAGGDAVVRALAEEWIRRMDAFFGVVSAGAEANHTAAIVAAHEAQPKALRNLSRQAATLHRPVMDALHVLMNGLAGTHCADADAFALLWPLELCASCDVTSRRLLPEEMPVPVVFEAFDEGVLQELDELCTHLAGVLVEAGITPLVVADVDPDTDALADPATAEPAVQRDLGTLAANEDQRGRCVALLMEALLADERVAKPVRTEVARLLPVLQAVAACDAGLLADGAHPLARLLNEIGHAGVGLQQRDAAADIVLERIGTLIDTLRAAEYPDAELQQQALTEWCAFARAESRRAQLVQRRVEEAEHAALLAAAANAAADEVLAEPMARRCMPSAAMELLREGWRRVLVSAWLRGGVEGRDWELALEDMQEFVALWTREAFGVPAALDQRMRDRMAHAGLDPLRIEILLSGISEAFASWDAPIGTERMPQGHVTAAHPTRPVPAPDSEAVAIARSVAPGSWYCFEGHGGAPVYGRFAAIIGTHHALLFVDREGRKLACYTPAQFAMQLRLHRATALPPRRWFDAALDAALAGMRGKQHHAA